VPPVEVLAEKAATVTESWFKAVALGCSVPLVQAPFTADVVATLPAEVGASNRTKCAYEDASSSSPFATEPVDLTRN